MGKLTRFDLERIIKDYNTTYFFESGTFLGDGVAYGLRFPFEKLISVEIIPEIAIKARNRFALNNKVKIIEADSITALEQILPALNKNILFWLDAHFPGADAGLTGYDEYSNEELRLPLQKEIETICNIRKGYNDVFILDDLRIYEDGNYENGNVPQDALPLVERNIDFISRCFSKTHCIFRSYHDEGYILLFPLKKYKKAHFSISNFFRKRTQEEDHYLQEPGFTIKKQELQKSGT